MKTTNRNQQSSSTNGINKTTAQKGINKPATNHRINTTNKQQKQHNKEAATRKMKTSQREFLKLIFLYFDLVYRRRQPGRL